ncbi:MAG TPA: hypothetical protein VFD36_27255 [Kofleriaceae bacterium]|nr:hypothetical protein [Kofleriaceae bacterium]
MILSCSFPRRIALACAALAACGGSDHRDTPIDAPAPPPIDAPVADAPPDAPSRVSVTVLTDTGSGQPDTSARVIFADLSNQLVQQGLVGAAGDASADLPRGGFVHVVHVVDDTQNNRAVALQSIRVQPGDSVTFGDAASAAQGARVTVDGTFTPLDGVVARYTWAHPCGSGTTEPGGGNVAHLSSIAGCLPPTFEVLGTTDVVTTTPAVMHFVWFTATPAGGFTAPAMDLMSNWATLIIHVPVGSTIQVERSTALPPYFNNAATVSTQLTATDTSVTASLYYPPPPDGSPAIGVVQARISPGGLDRKLQVLQARVAAKATSLAMDLEELPLPVVETVPVLSGKIVSWTQSGTAAPDLREVTVTSTYAAGGKNYAVTWTLIDGTSSSSVELPSLPTMFAEFDPTQQPAPKSGDGRVLYVNYSNVQGYEAARRLPLGSLTGHGVLRFGSGLFEGQLYSVRAAIH